MLKRKKLGIIMLKGQQKIPWKFRGEQNEKKAKFDKNKPTQNIVINLTCFQYNRVKTSL